MRRELKRRRLHEQLEPRYLLNAAPVAVNDPWYDTPLNTTLVVGTSDTTLLDNDWDPEGDSISASLVDGPANGTLSTFNSNGTFTYVPDTSFSGFDSFTYKVSDGTDDSNVVTVSIAIDGDFGVRTNQNELSQDQFLHTGGLALSEPLTPGIQLLYQSGTLPKPIVVIETSLLSGSSVPDDIDAQLTFDGSAGTTFNHDTTSLSAGDSLRFALQADASSLSSGHYDYSVELTANYSGGSTARTFTGSQDVVNRGGSSHPFGRGWQLAGLDELVADSSGALWVRSDGTSVWFADDGAGGFLPADGDLSFSGLVENGNNTFTLTAKSGEKINFDTSGKITSRVDRNDNSVDYTYTSGLLTTITDPFSRDITLTYTSGQLTSITDFASRSATLIYDGSGRLTSITQPDPDGAGSLSAPVTSFSYDATTHQLTQRTDALSQDTDYTYGTHGRLTTITHPDSSDIELESLQTIGLPTATTGNSLTAANPLGTITDERGYDSTFRVDRFGSTIEWNDQLGHKTLTSRNASGQSVKVIGADPDDAGSLTSPVTIFGYNPAGDLVYQQNPDATEVSWTYTAGFHQVASQTDELGRTVSFAYDTDGNLTTETDAAGFDTTHVYNSLGLRTSTTTPDPDDTGPLSASVTSFAYDSSGRLTTVTNPDSSTRTYGYDSADNLTSETDELSNAATSTYDALGRLTSSTDRESATISLEFDAIGQLIKQTDPLGNVTDYEFNNRGFQTKVTQPDPDGAGSLSRAESEYEFDLTGNLTQIVSDFIAGTTLPITHTYDAAGRRTKTEGPLVNVYTTFSYDNLNRLTLETEYQHLVTEYFYDSRGRTTSVSKSDGYDQTPPTTSYSYNDAGELIGVTDTRGYTTAYEYNSRGLLSKETLPDPDGAGSMFSQVSVYQYDNASRLIKNYGMFTRLTQYEYNNRDQLTKLTLPDADDSGPTGSPVLNYTYDAAGNRLTETDPLGNVTTFTFDKNGRVQTVTQPDPDDTGPLSSPVTSYAYNAVGNPTSVTDPNSGVTSFEYDNLGRQTKITQPDPDGAGSLTSPITLYEYSGGGKLSKVTDPEGRETTFQDDSIGRRSGVTDDLGNQTTYAYDNFDNVTSITEPDPDGAGSLTASVTTFSFDVFDRVTQKTDPEGGVTVTTYDDAGNVLTIKDPVNNTTSFAYDGMGRVTIETNQLSDTRSFQYEAAGNLARRTDRNGRVIHYTHDNLERLTKERWYASATPTPSLAVSTTTEGGERDEEQYVGFTSMVWGGTFTLTVNSQTTSSISYSATAAQVQTALEALSSIDSGDVAVTKETTQGSTKWNIVFQGALSGTDIAQSTINTSGLSGYGFSAIQGTDVTGGEFDEVQSVTLANASGGTFRLAWLGETTGALDYDATAAEVETALEDLNALDQVTVTGSPGGPWTVTFAGTHAGQDVDPILGDATSATSGTLTRTITLEYDKTNHITSADDADSSYAYTYDDLGRLLTVDNDGTSDVPNVVLTSAYDPVGNRTSLSATIDSTDDFENAYSYDLVGRLTRLDQIGVSGGNAVSEKRVDFAYNAVGQFDTIARYNDTAGGSGDEIATSTYSYDSAGRLTGLEYEKGSTDLFTPYSWTFDNAGRITQFVSEDGTSDYAYDKTSQLTDADHDYQSDESYSFDANGNRDSTGYTTGSDNRMTADGTYTYTYDDEGNRTSRTDDTTDYETLYEWDFRNRLTSVTELDDSDTVLKVVEYTYDVFNRRIAKAVDTTSPFDLADAAIERYVYDDLNGVSSVDGGNVVLDFVDSDGSGSTAISLSARQLYANRVDQILAKEDVTVSISNADRVQWPLVDNLGTVRDLVENEGTLGEHYEYDSFGNIVSGNTSVIRYLYTSREHDPDTGLQYNRARWYDAAVGRWISQDPIGFEAGDTNLYRYVANSTLRYNDPSGNQEASGEGEPLPDDVIEQEAKSRLKSALRKKTLEWLKNQEEVKSLQEGLKNRWKELQSKIPRLKKSDEVDDGLRRSSEDKKDKYRPIEFDLKWKIKPEDYRDPTGGWRGIFKFEIYLFPPRSAPVRPPLQIPDETPSPARDPDLYKFLTPDDIDLLIPDIPPN